MKIAVFTDTFSPQINGVAKTLNRLLDFYDKEGIEYIVFAPRFKERDDRKNVIRFRSYSLVFYKECRLSLPKYFKAKKILQVFKPDLVHIITEFTLGMVGMEYAKKHNVPVVSTYETDIPLYLKYYHASFLREPTWMMFRTFHNRSDCVFTPSYYTMNKLKGKGFNHVRVWERGIETDRFSPDFRSEEWRKEKGLDDKIVFLYVGRLSPEKHIDVFVDTAKELNKKYKDKIHFLIVGGGPSVEKITKEIPDNTELLGYLRGDELSKVYSSSDVFMFPSATETLGFVVVEAMASGLPVVCCEEGGVSDSVLVGETGYLCRKANVGDFAENASKLIDSPELLKEMGKKGREIAITKSWDNGFNKLYKDYLEIIEKRGTF